MTTTTTPLQTDEAHAAQMSIWEHLNELRKRITWAGLAVLIGTVIGFLVAGETLNILREPYCRVVELPSNCELVILDPTGSIFEYMRVALLVGGILAIPMVTYQIMMYVLPALTRKEKRYVLLSLPFITALFLTGVWFAWNVFLPPALNFLESFGTNTFRTEWTAELYIGFVTSLVFWMGVAFEMPLVFFTLSLLGAVTARPMIRNWRFAIVGAAIVAAFITPTIDPMNMLLVMSPLLSLYVISILLVWVGGRIIKPKEA